MPFFEPFRSSLPQHLRELVARHEVYRDVRYVTAQVNSLAEQLSAVRARTAEGG